jgi:hypothetical protein
MRNKIAVNEGYSDKSLKSIANPFGNGQQHNAGIDPLGDNCMTDKFSIKGMLMPVGSNPLLDRLVAAARARAELLSALFRVAAFRRV